MRWLAATAVLVVLATSACSGDDEPQPKAPAATPDRAATACSLLSSADRQELTGQEVDTISDRARAAIGLQCRWADADTFVEASSLPAADWADRFTLGLAQVVAKAVLGFGGGDLHDRLPYKEWPF